MVYFEKSQPAPASLNVEKSKLNGDYKGVDVLKQLKQDFYNKCYICESKSPTTINVEHFSPHFDDQGLKFDWNNLFWACAHCNNTKRHTHTNLLNCTKSSDFVGLKLKYLFNPFPYEKVRIVALVNTQEALNTKALLEDVYNGTTVLKTIESSNLRDNLLNEICDFQEALRDYFRDTNTKKEKKRLFNAIKRHLHRASNFTAFKRWVIIENETLYATFSNLID